MWGDCLVPRRWWQDWRLGEWVADVRHAHKEGRLTPTQLEALDAAGFIFKLPAVRSCSCPSVLAFHMNSWYLRVYSLWRRPEPHYGTPGKLGGELNDMQGVADWNHLFHELRRFREEHGQDGPGFKWRDPLADFTNNFAKWYHQQPELFKQRLLLPDQVCCFPLSLDCQVSQVLHMGRPG